MHNRGGNGARPAPHVLARGWHPSGMRESVRNPVRVMVEMGQAAGSAERGATMVELAGGLQLHLQNGNGHKVGYIVSTHGKKHDLFSLLLLAVLYAFPGFPGFARHNQDCHRYLKSKKLVGHRAKALMKEVINQRHL
ncbi:hypothetical protein GOP47_0003646 [Adiantum capillus-veneris]|uniref:Uncharacterized protein n=1 Tax=Adiantum capillus-veneris TaxID=13818 RepID=A0A9D4V786_ADICA|nr:hypothetical protein GOP47_0003646 [Adiantum capillus-veneris]